MASVLIPRAALACGGCTDRILLFRFPFVPVWLLFFFGWLIAVAILKRALGRRPTNVDDALPSDRTIVVMFFGSLVSIVGLSLALMGSLILPAAIIGSLGIVAMLLTGTRALRHGGGFSTRAFVVITATCLVGIALAVPVRLNTAWAPASQVRALSQTYAHVDAETLRRVIALGTEATPLLIERARELERQQPRERHSARILGVYLFALAQICQRDDSAALAGWAQRLADDGSKNYERGDGQFLFADALCSGEAAVPRIEDVLRQSPAAVEGAEPPALRVAALVALVQTMSPAGISRALDEVAVLRAAADHPRMPDSLDLIAAETLEVLLDGTTREALATVSGFRTRLVSGSDTDDAFVRAFNRSPDTFPLSDERRAALDANLEARTRDARVRWATALEERERRQK
jgi:hypothetical protein